MKRINNIANESAKADFCLEIKYKKDSENPSRIFRAMSGLIDSFQDFDKHLVKSITVDRGKEFAGYNTIEAALECDVYFADAYCSWQRGTNENTNGLLREFFPKGINFDLINSCEVVLATSLINNRPRKCIGFSKPIDYIIQCCT